MCHHARMVEEVEAARRTLYRLWLSTLDDGFTDPSYQEASRLIDEATIQHLNQQFQS